MRSQTNIDKKRRILYAMSFGRCSVCGCYIQNSNKFDKTTYMTIDHIIPKSKGGTNDITNLRPTCKRCNQEKADNLIGVYALMI